jgi:hypothetical protein
MTRSAIPLCLSHFIGNALILWLGYYWLGIDESDTAHLIWSALVILLFLCSALWLHGTALAYFNHEAPLNFLRAAMLVTRNLLPLFGLAVVAVASYWVVAYLDGKFTHQSFLIASYVTLHFRRPVPPARVLDCYHALLSAFRWLVIPAIVWPLAGSVARRGWRGFHPRSLRRRAHVLYCLQVCALMLLGIWVPLRLLKWIPQLQSFNAQFASLAGRLALGYLLFVAALLSIEFFTSAGTPRATQPSTAPSP